MNRRVSQRGFTLIELTITIVVILILASIALSIGNRVLRKSESDETMAAMEIAATAMHEWIESMGRQPTYGTLDNGWSYMLQGMDDPSAWRYDIVIPEDLVGDTQVATLLALRERQLQESVEELGQQFWAKMQAVESTRAVMAKIDSDLLLAEEENGSVSQCLHDAWGTPVMIVFPGRKWRTDGASDQYNDAEDAGNGCWRDDDGTVRTFEERLQGPARNGRPYLVSAGPDGRFGNVDFRISAGESFPPQGDAEFLQRAEYQQSLDNIYSYEVRTW